jgi:hypothetical protein
MSAASYSELRMRPRSAGQQPRTISGEGAVKQSRKSEDGFIKQPTSSTPASWEITSDDETTTLHLEQTRRLYSLHQEPAVRSILVKPPAAPGSFPTSWRDYAKANANANSNFNADNSRNIRLGLPSAPRSFSGLGTAPIIRTALHVPDSSYHAYLLGKSNKRKHNLVDVICCAKFCAFFSWIAVMFLVFIGILLDTQPLYIKGTLPQHIQYTSGKKPQIFYAVTYSERLQTASNAYQAAFVYLVTGLFSLAYAYNWFWWIKSRWRQYNDIPDNADSYSSHADSTIPTFHTTADGDLPYSPTQAYQYHNRVRAQVKIWFFKTVARLSHFVMSIMPGDGNRRPRRRGATAKDV